jgi:DNA-binding transcriptional regulator PaaX
MSLIDPDLPDQLLPAQWPRDEARAMFVELYDLLAPLEQSECGEISRMDDIKYAYRHFRGPDGKVYGLNEQK